MLSLREKEVLEFIRDFKGRYSKVPSARQITSQLGFKSSRSAQNYITSLKDKGRLLSREPEPSSYVLPEDIQNTQPHVILPFLGLIAAGHPAEIYSNGGRYIEFSTKFFGASNDQDLFALQVMGNSMIGDSICDGDIAIIKRQSESFQKDDILAVEVRNEEFTLKRIVHKNEIVELIPSNPKYPIIEVPSEQVRIVGKYLGLLRRS